MAKAAKKKPAAEASDLFQSIVAASVKGNPRPESKPVKILRLIKEEIVKIVPDYEDLLFIVIRETKPYVISYRMLPNCPPTKAHRMESIIKHFATLYEVHSVAI